MNGVPFVKAHGTENDFVLLPDRLGTLLVTDSQVRALCDRRSGLGADGVIVARPAVAPEAGYFMDYRNADGSVAQMCGNGARVFARFLVDAGWEQPGSFSFVTRGGVRSAEIGTEGDVSIEMGPARIGVESVAKQGGLAMRGTAVDVGNPHLVCVLADHESLDALDLSAGPQFDTVLFPQGVNVEFVVRRSANHLRMRVFERGVGETRSCGTGTVAVAAAHLAAAGITSGHVRVDVPGGTVVVTAGESGFTLAGPVVMVGSGTIDQRFWDLHRAAAPPSDAGR